MSINITNTPDRRETNALKKLFTDIGKVESQHVQTITTMLDTGTTPPMNGGSPAYPNGNVCGNYTDTTKKDADKFLCEDSLDRKARLVRVRYLHIRVLRYRRTRRAQPYSEGRAGARQGNLYLYVQKRNGTELLTKRILSSS